MLKKILNQGLFAIVMLMVFFGFISESTFAAESTTKVYPVNQVGMEWKTDIIQTDDQIYGVAIEMEKEGGLWINTFPFGGGVWEELEIEDEEEGVNPSALGIFEPTRTLQIKTNVAVSELSVTLIYYDKAEVSGMEDIKSDYLVSGPLYAKSGVNIIKRRTWGADESIRYSDPSVRVSTSNMDTSRGSVDDENEVGICSAYDKYEKEYKVSQVRNYSPQGQELLWPLQYSKTIGRIVVHHTATEVRDINGDNRMDSRDYAAIVRAIYHYHAETRKWGDVGYNYLIDPLGNIYEGRYGGDKVVGGHVLCHNQGTIGISLIGNYQNNQVPEPALQALSDLVALKAKQHNLNTKGKNIFRGNEDYSVIGHRDLRSTSCPGKNLYSKLDWVRKKVGLLNQGNVYMDDGSSNVLNLDYNADLIKMPDSVSLNPNEIRKINIKFKNTGKKTWDSNTWLHVALNNAKSGRIKPIFEDKKFVAALMKEEYVAPGKTATFEVQLEAGYDATSYSFEVAPVVNARFKISRAASTVNFSVKRPTYDYEYVRSEMPPELIYEGQDVYAWVELKNTGNVVWRNYGANQIKLGTTNPRDHKSIVAANEPTRLGYLVQSEVPPGEVGRFSIHLDVPRLHKGYISENFAPIIEGVHWYENNSKLQFKSIIKKPIHLARVVKVDDIKTLMPGEKAKLEIKLTNLGDLSWTRDNMTAILESSGIKVFKSSLKPVDPVKPKKDITFDFWIQAPFEAGNYTISIKSKFDFSFIRGGSTNYNIRVSRPSLRARIMDQGDRLIKVSPGQIKTVSVEIKNIGNVTWYKDGDNAVRLAPTDPRDHISDLYYEGGWIDKFRAAKMKEKEVKPGEVGTFSFKIKPSKTGVINENFQLVMENVGWIYGKVRWNFKFYNKNYSTSSQAAKKLYEPKNPKEYLRASDIKKEEVITTSTAPKTPTKKTNSSSKRYISPAGDESLFRVKLSHEDSSPIVTGHTSFNVTDEYGNILFSPRALQRVNVRTVNGNFYVRYGNHEVSTPTVRFSPKTEGIIEIANMERRPSWNKNLNDNKFRGTIELQMINNKVVYINELSLEDYVKGIAEVSNSTHFEKQKTIAVLARTYARHYMDENFRKFPGMPYDGSDDPNIFQRYLGYGVESRSPNFKGAVEVTKDEVVTYKGQLVKTPYFNQSDGRTKSAKEMWGWTDTPYLISVPDPYCEGKVLKGHGVGLSGYGSEMAANNGKTYDEIIKYYYTGVEIEEKPFD